VGREPYLVGQGIPSWHEFPTTSPEALMPWALLREQLALGSVLTFFTVYVVLAALALLAPTRPETKARSRTRHTATVAATAAIILG
jgi:hypothetical protein